MVYRKGLKKKKTVEQKGEIHLAKQKVLPQVLKKKVSIKKKKK